MGCLVWENSKTYSGTTVATSKERLHCYRHIFYCWTAVTITAHLPHPVTIVTWHHICSRSEIAEHQ